MNGLTVFWILTVYINVQKDNYTLDPYSSLGYVHHIIASLEEFVVVLHHLGTNLFRALFKYDVHESID